MSGFDVSFRTELDTATRAQLDRIESGLQRLEVAMSEQEAALDAALAQAASAQAENAAAAEENHRLTEELIALFQSSQVDLGDETATAAAIIEGIRSSASKVQETNAAITAALPPVPPTEPPVEEPPA